MAAITQSIALPDGRLVVDYLRTKNCYNAVTGILRLPSQACTLRHLAASSYNQYPEVDGWFVSCV